MAASVQDLILAANMKNRAKSPVLDVLNQFVRGVASQNVGQLMYAHKMKQAEIQRQIDEAKRIQTEKAERQRKAEEVAKRLREQGLAETTTVDSSTGKVSSSFAPPAKQNYQYIYDKNGNLVKTVPINKGDKVYVTGDEPDWEKRERDRRNMETAQETIDAYNIALESGEPVSPELKAGAMKAAKTLGREIDKYETVPSEGKGILELMKDQAMGAVPFVNQVYEPRKLPADITRERENPLITTPGPKQAISQDQARAYRDRAIQVLSDKGVPSPTREQLKQVMMQMATEDGYSF